MTVILGTAFEASPGHITAFTELFTKGTEIAERFGTKVHRLQGYIGAPPTQLTAVLEFDNYAALAEFTTTRDEDRDWQEFSRLAMATPVARQIASFDAVEVAGLENSEKLKTGAVHVTVLDPVQAKMPILITQLHDIKEIQEKEGAQIHVRRHTTGELNGKISYACEFDNVIELGKFADKLERNMPYQDLMAKIAADQACTVLRSASYKSLV